MEWKKKYFVWRYNLIEDKNDKSWILHWGRVLLQNYDHVLKINVLHDSIVKCKVCVYD